MLVGLAKSTHADVDARAKKLGSSPEFNWQRKIKEKLDPNSVSSGNYFWGADQSKE
jgi:hypothetical protein